MSSDNDSKAINYNNYYEGSLNITIFYIFHLRRNDKNYAPLLAPTHSVVDFLYFVQIILYNVVFYLTSAVTDLYKVNSKLGYL